jgi:murein DD-endopeptidase MepM/ murein hydrolase activator NlpD
MSKKTKYIFDQKTLSFKIKKTTLKEKVKHISFSVGFGLVLAVVFIVAIYYLVDSPKEKILERQVQAYERNYNVLNKRVNTLSDIVVDLEGRDKDVYRVIFEAEPNQLEFEKAKKVKDEYEALKRETNNNELVLMTTKKIDELSKRLYIQSKSLDEVFGMAKTKKERLLCMPAILPVSKTVSHLISGFGMRFHPILQIRRMHTGIDFSAPTGTPIYATGDGVVAESEGSGNGYGLAVKINHGFGFETLYAHMSKIMVKTGQKVKRGDVIGLVGSTGLAQAPHLHYEVHKNGIQVNPVYYFFNDLSVDEYEEVIEKSQQDNQSLS